MSKRTAENSAAVLRRAAADLLRISSEIEPQDFDLRQLEHANKDQPDLSIFFGSQDVLLQAVKASYRERRRRKKFLPPDLFGEAAWDILLDLFAARLEQRKISVTSACIGADVPATTALRWLGQLEQIGFINRTVSETDQRVTWVQLTDICGKIMTAYFQSRPISPGKPEYSLSSHLLLTNEDE